MYFPRKILLWSDSVLFSLLIKKLHRNKLAVLDEVPVLSPEMQNGSHRMSKVKYDSAYAVSRHGYRWHQRKGVERGISWQQQKRED